MKSAARRTKPRYYIEFTCKLPHFHKPKPLTLCVPIKVKHVKEMDPDELACLTDESGKLEIHLSSDRNIRQHSRDTEHEMDHLWGAFMKQLHDAYVDYKRVVLED